MAEQYVLFCVRLHFSTTIWVVVLKRNYPYGGTKIQTKTYYSAIFNYVHHVLFLLSNYLEISIKIKHSFTSFDSHLLYLASTCFLTLPFNFFHFCWLSFTSVYIRLHLFASVCILVPPVKL